MVIMITGSAGFVGRHLTRHFLNLGHKVIALDLVDTGIYHPNITNLSCGLEELESLQLKGVDILFHLAAKISFENSLNNFSEMMRINVLNSFKLTEFIKRNAIKKVILSSTCSVYAENYDPHIWITESTNLLPQNFYAQSKLASELAFQNSLNGFTDNFIILRYSSIYGTGQSKKTILPQFIEDAINNKPIKIYGNGKRVQDYVHINDILQANEKCLSTELNFNTVVNIGSGDPSTDLELAEKIKRIWNSNSTIEILNMNDKKNSIQNYSITRAKEKINYIPLSLSQGLLLIKQKDL